MSPELEKALAEINAATAGMTEAQLLFQPAGKWSSAEILEHLSLAFSNTVKGAERALSAGQPIASAPTVRDRLVTFLVVRLGVIPRGRKAPKMTEPTGKLGGLEAVERIRAELAAMDAKLNQCHSAFGSRRLMNHPVLGPLTVAEWRKFHLVHTRHHMRQVERLRTACGQAAQSAKA